MPRVAHFEVMANDPEQAAKFYGGVFGWKVDRWDGPQEYWLITTGDDSEPGINGGFVRRPDPSAPGVVNTVNVSSLDEAVSAVEEHGGKVAMPKMAVAGIGWLAYCTDPEGTMFGLMEADQAAS